PLQKIVFLTKHTHSGRAFVQLSPSLRRFVNTHDSKFHLFVMEKGACAACADLKKNNILSEMRAFVDKIIHTSPNSAKEWRALEIRHFMQENVKLEKMLEKLM
ncbi:MAG TPA: hypothetical protein VEK38_03220, partial [Candidatus Bathyarchaeia archaeon]|nr:hypothetical protein [Candidatus Bathyarchaeia archaeon]